MAGNVWEWTSTSGESFSRVVHGGAYFNDARYVRCAKRITHDPNYRREHTGFRVVASPTP